MPAANPIGGPLGGLRGRAINLHSAKVGINGGGGAQTNSPAGQLIRVRPSVRPSVLASSSLSQEFALEFALGVERRGGRWGWRIPAGQPAGRPADCERNRE